MRNTVLNNITHGHYSIHLQSLSGLTKGDTYSVTVQIPTELEIVAQPGLEFEGSVYGVQPSLRFLDPNVSVGSLLYVILSI